MWVYDDRTLRILAANDPAIDVATFPETPSDYFWTSSPLADSALSAWYIFFLDGNAHSTGIDSSYRARCARSSAARSRACGPKRGA